MTGTPAPLSRERFEARLRALLRQGTGPGWPRKQENRSVLLVALATTLPRDADLDEFAVNDAIRTWLAGPAQKLELDHVSLRRALVDDGFLERARDGARYRRSDRWRNRLALDFDPNRPPGPARLEGDEIAALAAALPAWRIVEIDGVPRLERDFRFPDFAAALAFTNRVGALAEARDHHPALLTEWGRVTVAWWTHSIGGLSRNDVEMAAQTDVLEQPGSGPGPAAGGGAA
jgi:4a-hydroxytetrahydrobiopterin dehydratase